jgi:outer membrane protein assembly factor BamB
MNSPSQQKLVFFSDQSLNDEVDNWYSVYNILTRGNARCFLSGNSQKTQVHSLSGIPELSNGSLQRKNQEPVYSTVSVLKDTLLFSEIASDESVTDWAVIPLNEKYAPSVVDTTESNNYYTEFIWVKELNRTVNAAPVVINEKIYLPTISGEVYCFDSNGNVLWKAQAHAPISGRVAVAQGVAVVATTEGDIITYDAETGRVIQSIGTDEKLTSTPVIFKTTYRGDETYGVLIGTATGKMLCFELSSLNVIWENKSATGLIQSVPVPVNDRVVFGSWDGSLYCVDALTGELNWKWNESRSSAFSPAACVPQVGGGAVFVVSPDHYLSKIDLLLGKTIWRKREFDAWESVGISSDKKRLYVKSAFNKFFIVSAADGKRLKEYDLKNGADYAAIEPREFGTDVLTGTEHGFVWQLSSLGPKKLFYMGAARITGVIQTGDNTFIAGNVDGKLVLFSMPEEN